MGRSDVSDCSGINVTWSWWSVSPNRSLVDLQKSSVMESCWVTPSKLTWAETKQKKKIENQWQTHKKWSSQLVFKNAAIMQNSTIIRYFNLFYTNLIHWVTLHFFALVNKLSHFQKQKNLLWNAVIFTRYILKSTAFHQVMLQYEWQTLNKSKVLSIKCLKQIIKIEEEKKLTFEFSMTRPFWT